MSKGSWSLVTNFLNIEIISVISNTYCSNFRFKLDKVYNLLSQAAPLYSKPVSHVQLNVSVASPSMVALVHVALAAHVL